jgi:hypothetical protein
MDLQRSHFLHPALVALRAAEASFEKCLNQLPGQCWPYHLSAERKDIHVVVLNALVSGEDIMDEPSAYTSNFIGADGCAYAAAAEHDSTIHCARGYGPGQGNHVIRVIVSGAQLERSEVYDLMGSTAQQIRDLLFQSEPSMVRRNSYTHDVFSLSWSST